MKSKGTFTSLIGLLALTLIISSAYFTLTSISLQEGPALLRQAGDLKRVMNETRFRIDEAVAQSLANQACISGCNPVQNYAVDSAISNVLDDVKNETGVVCSHDPVGTVSNNVPFTVTLNCSLTAEKNGKTEQSVETTLSFNLQKSVAASMNGVCNVTVTDMHSGLPQATVSC